MEGRSYKTAFTIAKIGEILAWIIIVIGILIGFSLIRDLNVKWGFAIMGIIAIVGIILVYLAQLTLIFIDTENNTREVMREIRKTNAMLAETIGSIAANLKKIVEKEQV